MYNEELKNKFIRDHTKSESTAKVCRTIFNRIEPYEIAWGSDICTRSVDELTPVIETIIGMRERSRCMSMATLREYVKWCINVENVYGARNDILSVNITGIEKMKHQTVANPLQLQKYLNQLFLPESRQSIDNIYRCYFWLAYGGVDERDILSIKQSDVDFNEMVVHYNKTDIPIYREAVPAFKNCVSLNQFAYFHPNYSKIIFKNRVDGDELVRGYSGNYSIYSIRTQVSKRAKESESKTSLRLSYFRVWISGLFYRAYEREIAGDKPNFYGSALQVTGHKPYKLDDGKNVTEEYKRKMLARGYKKDYERWKLAFGL